MSLNSCRKAGLSTSLCGPYTPVTHQWSVGEDAEETEDTQAVMAFSDQEGLETLRQRESQANRIPPRVPSAARK